MYEQLPTTHLINILTEQLNGHAETLLRNPFGISYNEYLLLLHIAQQPQITQNQLVHAARLTKGAVSKIIKLMIAKDLLVVEQDEFDARVNHVSCTKKGMNMYLDATALLEQEFMSFYQSFESEAKIQDFNAQLVKLIYKLEEKR